MPGFHSATEAVGGMVTRFEPGDEVFGGRYGAFAEYMTVRKGRALARTPADVTFDQAASVSAAAITDQQALRGNGKVEAATKAPRSGELSPVIDLQSWSIVFVLIQLVIRLFSGD